MKMQNKVITAAVIGAVLFLIAAPLIGDSLRRFSPDTTPDGGPADTTLRAERATTPTAAGTEETNEPRTMTSGEILESVGGAFSCGVGLVIAFALIFGIWLRSRRADTPNQTSG